jgi:hypothetical protein
MSTTVERSETRTSCRTIYTSSGNEPMNWGIVTNGSATTLFSDPPQPVPISSPPRLSGPGYPHHRNRRHHRALTTNQESVPAVPLIR